MQLQSVSITYAGLLIFAYLNFRIWVHKYSSRWLMPLGLLPLLIPGLFITCPKLLGKTFPLQAMPLWKTEVDQLETGPFRNRPNFSVYY